MSCHEYTLFILQYNSIEINYEYLYLPIQPSNIVTSGLNYLNRTNEFPASRIADGIKRLDIGKDIEDFLIYNLPYLNRRWDQQKRLITRPPILDVVDVMRHSERVHNVMDFRNSIAKTDLVNIVSSTFVCSSFVARTMVDQAIAENRLRETSIGKKSKRITLITSEL